MPEAQPPPAKVQRLSDTRVRDAPNCWAPTVEAGPPCPFAMPTPLPMPLPFMLPQPVLVERVDPRRARFKRDPKWPMAGLLREEGGIFGHMDSLKSL